MDSGAARASPCVFDSCDARVTKAQTGVATPAARGVAHADEDVVVCDSWRALGGGDLRFPALARDARSCRRIAIIAKAFVSISTATSARKQKATRATSSRPLCNYKKGHLYNTGIQILQITIYPNWQYMTCYAVLNVQNKNIQTFFLENIMLRTCIYFVLLIYGIVS